MKKKQIFLNLGFIILCALIIYPFLMLVSVSISSEADIALYGYKLIPKHIDFEAYKYVFSILLNSLKRARLALTTVRLLM